VKVGRLAAATAGLVSLAVAAPAAACGGDGPAGPVVGRGVSSGGQVWTQQACHNGPELVLTLSLPQADGEDFGGGLGAPPPSRRSPLIVAAPGSDIGPAGEGELDGMAFRTVTRVRIAFAAGAPVVATTRPAPLAARRHHAYLLQLRFFVVFCAGSRRPTSVTALGATGRTLARQAVG
jgi:hypothetical protein